MPFEHFTTTTTHDSGLADESSRSWRRFVQCAAISAATMFVVPIAAVQAQTTTAPAPAATAADSSFEDRLLELQERLEERRQALHIPGMAFVVVHNDEIVLARGFGVSDMESNSPVDADTLFAIGSSTKAFAAVTAAMMVDEGKMDWEDPITKWIPAFDLEVESADPDAAVNIIDCLAHRSGFTRMGVLWAGNAVDRETMWATAAKAKPLAPFRQTFLYNNVTYAAGGYAASAAAEVPFRELMQQRLFDPLGMDDSTFSIEKARATGHLSQGYSWNEDAESHTHQTMRELDLVDPAGGILSNAVDMGQWVRFQLGRGIFNGERLLSDDAHEMTWTPHMEIAPGMGYGLGWMLQEWEGQPVIQHGGNIDGFACMVGLLPEEQLGFALMMNVSTSELQNSSINLVWDVLAGAPVESGATDDAATGDDSITDFVGEYTANFGPFNDSTFTVTEEDGTLFLDIPDQQVYTLRGPDENGHRMFDEFPAAAISFVRNDDGNVTGAELHQGGMTFEIPRKGVEVAGEIPLEELQPYLGTYHFAEQNVDIEVLIQNNRLAVDVPGQMVFELHPPNDEGLWQFRVTDQVNVSFDVDGGTMTMHQAGMQFEMKRVAAAEGQPDLPTVDDIMELRQSAAKMQLMKEIGTVFVKSNILMEQSGVSGVVDAYFNVEQELSYSESDLGDFAWEHSFRDGDSVVSAASLDDFKILEGRELQQALYGNFEVLIDDWRNSYDEVKVTKRETVDGVDLVTMSLVPSHGLPRQKVFVDMATGDIVRIEGGIYNADLSITIPMTTVLSDYREINGMRMPYRTVTSNQFSGNTITTVAEVKIDTDFDFGAISVESLRAHHEKHRH